MMKRTILKIISTMLSVAMLSTIIPMQALAVSENGSQKKDEAVALSSDGKELRFVLQKATGNTYEMAFYMDNVLIRTHTINPGISVQTKDIQSGKITTTAVSKGTQELLTIESDVARGPIRWTHLGYMHYKNSSTFGCEAIAAISCRSTGSYPSTYYVDTAVSKTVDLAVAAVAAVLLADAIGVYIATQAIAATIAQRIVMDMAVATGAGVIGDAFGGIFREAYDCTRTDYSISTQVLGTGITNSSKVTYSGTVYTVDYGNQSYATEHDPDDYYNPENWKHPLFAKEIWEDSLPGSPTFPGIYTTYPYNYPL